MGDPHPEPDNDYLNFAFVSNLFKGKRDTIHFWKVKKYDEWDFTCIYKRQGFNHYVWSNSFSPLN